MSMNYINLIRDSFYNYLYIRDLGNICTKTRSMSITFLTSRLIELFY